MKRLVLVALAAVALAACGGGDGGGDVTTAGGPAPARAGTPKPGGTLTIGAASTIPQLNPVLKGTAWEQTLFSLMWDGLTKVDRKGKIVPDLATRWTSSDDYKTWTFTLRDGVKFSNGTPVTPSLVVRNLKYYKAPDTATQQKTALAPLKRVRAAGADRVVFELDEPNVLFPSQLTDVKMVDVDALETINKHPAVTGPFKVDDFVPDDHLTLVRNPGYFGPPAPLDRIRMVKAADATSAVTSLRSGDLDALWAVPSSDVPQLEHDANLTVVKPETTGLYVSWEVDMKSPPFDDIRARQALAYAVDREAILKAAYYNQGFVAKTNTPLVEDSPWFAQGLKEYPYDLDKAKQLFQAAGVHTFTWWGMAGQYPEWATSAQILQASLKKIGVTMKIHNTETGTWPNRFYPAGKRFPGLLVPNFQSFPAHPFYQFFFPRKGRCECNWESPEYERTYEQALATPTGEAQNALWDKAQKLMNEDVPLIIPLQTMTETATKKSVAGVWVEAAGHVHLESAGFAG